MAQQLALDLDAPTKEAQKLWQAYGPKTSKADARALFREKFGHYPHEIKRTAGCVLVGPLTADELEAKKQGG